MTKATKTLATLVGVKRIVKRPYKVNIEVRLASDGFAVTIVARGTKPLANISRILRKYGYKYAVYIDSYGFVRLHIRNLTISDVALIEKIAYEGLSTLSKTRHDEFLMIAS